MTNFTFSNSASIMNDLLQTLRPEEQLLLALCHLEFTREQKAWIRELMVKVTDWGYFVRMANAHGIIALCWHNITETGNSDFIPKESLETLHKGYLISLARNTKIYSLLDEVLDLANKAGIKVVLLKGLALEKTVYGNKGLRQMNDLDILVKREDAIKLRKILLENGFESDPLYSPLHEKILPNYGKHLPEMLKNGLATEIHFNLFDASGRIVTSKFTDRAVPVQIGQKDALCLSPQDEFLYLIKHLDRHEKEGKSQLRMYADLLIKCDQNSYEIFNENLSVGAVEAGIDTAIENKVLILNKICSKELWFFNSEDLEKLDKDAPIESFIKFVKKPGTNLPIVNPEDLLKPLSDLGTWNKILYLLGVLFPSITFMKFRYKVRSKIAAIVYYPVRWGNFAVHVIRGKM